MIVTEKQIQQIDQGTLDLIRQHASSGEVVRLSLPDWGWLYLEPGVPFLFLYRPPEEERSWESELLVLTEAACLASDPSTEGLDHLILEIVRSGLADGDERFLIVEVVNGDLVDAAKEERPTPTPSFRVSWDAADEAAKSVANAFESFATSSYILGEKPEVELSPVENFELLCSAEGAVVHLKIEIFPVHVNPETETPFPIVLQHFRRQLSNVFRQTLCHFENKLTGRSPTSWRALGRHDVLETDWLVDRQLTGIADSFSFLLDVTPVNQSAAWREFEANGFSEMPRFIYRRLTIDPEIVKGDLYRIPVDEVEDPILCHLYREKRAEISRMLTMLEERQTPRFIYGSLQLYGDVEDELFDLAIEMLRRIEPPHGASSERVEAEEFADMARAEIDCYLEQTNGIETGVEILPEVTSLIVTNGTLCVPKSLSLPKTRVRALLNHEVGTHVVTWINGKSQKLEQLYTGLAGYDELQEGLAVLSEYFAEQLSDARLRLLAGRVVAARRLVEHGDFVKAFEELVALKFSRKQAFGICVRVWRGGGLTKDAIYLRGLKELLDWLANGGDINLLYIGKITKAHIPLMEELLEREILHQPPVRPAYLDQASTKSKLEALSKGMSVLDLRSQN